jgi:outer membrane protein assembly factor BamB
MGSANIRWKVRVPGMSNSSPIVSGGRVFVTTAWGKRKHKSFGGNEPLNRVVMAFDLATGDRLWERVVFERTAQERRHHLNTPAAVTPTADGERIYVYFGMGLAALDYEGNLLWEQEVDPNYIERARYGVVSAPIVVGDAVIVVRDDEWGGEEIEDISWLAAYDRETGRELWRSENDETCCSYSTPVVRRTSRGPEVIFPSTPFTAAYDPSSGERLWTVEHESRQVVPTLLVADDLLIQAGSVHHRSIDVWRLTSEGAATTTEHLWNSSRASPKIPSPLLINGNLVILTDNGILAAYDPATGERQWQERLAGGDYRASLVAADGKIFATSTTCQISVVSPEGRTLALNQLEGSCEATPAIADGAILVRTAKLLYCIEKFDKGDDADEQVDAGEPTS